MYDHANCWKWCTERCTIALTFRPSRHLTMRSCRGSPPREARNPTWRRTWGWQPFATHMVVALHERQSPYFHQEERSNQTSHSQAVA